jgi:hypothetical protein
MSASKIATNLVGCAVRVHFGLRDEDIVAAQTMSGTYRFAGQTGKIVSVYLVSGTPMYTVNIAGTLLDVVASSITIL